MKNSTIEKSAFLGVLFFGLTAAAGASTIAMNVATASAQDSLQLGISETLTANVANIAGIGWVNEIDLSVTNIGGTYLNGADPIPSTAGINNVVGNFYTVDANNNPIGGLYLPVSRGAAEPLATVNGATGYSFGYPSSPPAIGGSPNAPYSELNFDYAGDVLPSPPPARCRGRAVGGWPRTLPAVGARVPRIAT